MGEKVKTLKIANKDEGNSVEQKENTKLNESSSSREDIPKSKKEEVIKLEKEETASYSTNNRRIAKKEAMEYFHIKVRVTLMKFIGFVNINV